MVSMSKMVGGGAHVLRRYPGLVGTLYAVQLAVAFGAGWVMTRILESAFANEPLFDAAVDDDTVALITVIAEKPTVFASVMWVGIGALGLYAVLSWFLSGGLIATLLETPRGRRETARCFGAGGAATFLAYARLGLLCIIPYGIALVVAGIGLDRAAADLPYALTVGDVARALVPNLAPAAILLWIAFTAVDYARIDLSRHPNQSSFRALLRAYKKLFTSRWPLVHVLMYYMAFVAISLVFLAATIDQPMTGAAGALTLFAIRQITSMVRFAAKVVLVGGQVELAETFEPPQPRAKKSKGKAKRDADVSVAAEPAT
jgi:hypothetical protein